jgi:hypothetical protein
MGFNCDSTVIPIGANPHSAWLVVNQQPQPEPILVIQTLETLQGQCALVVGRWSLLQ